MKTLDLQEASEMLKMHPQTVRRMAVAGELPAAKPGKCWVFIEGDLKAWRDKDDTPLQIPLEVVDNEHFEMLLRCANRMCGQFPDIPAKVNIQKANIQSDKYHVYRAVATPGWLTHGERTQMRALYRLAADTGLSVDHIVPLRGRNICGLHVPWNLRLIHLRENQRKNNIHDELI